MVTSGYYNDPDATAAAITDGWLHTGDYARVDSEGYVFILDRKKDMITRGGFKVYSVELEYLLVSHPDIAEAAVFGIPDRVAFESVAAQVVPADGASIGVQDIQQWVASRMAEYAVPRHVRIVASLPRNRTGKIDKRALREELLAELAGKGVGASTTEGSTR
jgi:long-chain acyl-CoA synthetase